LSQRIIGSNTMIQGALPEILQSTPTSFFDETIAQVEENAQLAFEKLGLCAGLHPVKPKGAMYIMVGIEMERFPHFGTEFHFVEALVSQQSVFCLPGKCFDYPDYFRIVLTVPKEQLLIALQRITEFCHQHYVEQKRPTHSIVQLGGEPLTIQHNIPNNNYRQSLGKT